MTGQFGTSPEMELSHTCLCKFSSFPARLKTVLKGGTARLLHSRIVAGVITLAQKSGQRRCYARIRWVWTMTMTAANDEGGAKKFQGSAQLESAKAVLMLTSRRLPTAVLAHGQSQQSPRSRSRKTSR